MPYASTNDIMQDAYKLAEYIATGQDLPPTAIELYDKFKSQVPSGSADELIRKAQVSLKDKGSREAFGSLLNDADKALRVTTPWNEKQMGALERSVLNMANSQRRDELVKEAGPIGAIKALSGGFATELANLAMGAQQLGLKALDPMLENTKYPYAAEDASRDIESQRDFMNEMLANSLTSIPERTAAFAGSVIPSIAGSLRIPGNSVIGQGAYGGTVGAVHPDQDVLSGALLGAGGALAGRAGTNIFSQKDLPSLQHQSLTDLVKRQEAKGFWASPGLHSGSDVMKWTDASLSRRPEMAAKFQHYTTQNQNLYNQEVARAMGLPGDTDRVTWEVLENHISDLGREIGERYREYPLVFETEDLTRIKNIERSLKNRIGSADRNNRVQNSVFKTKVDRLINFYKRQQTEGTFLNGEALKELRGEINDLIKHNYGPTGNKMLAKSYRSLLEVMDDGIERSIPDPATRALMKKERSEYAFTMNAVNNNIFTPTGNVRPEGVARLYRKGQRYNTQFRKLHPEIFDTTRFMLAQKEALSKSTMPVSTRVSHYFQPVYKRGRSLPVTSILTGELGNVKVPFFNNLAANLYLWGWPSRTGFFGPKLSPSALTAERMGYFTGGAAQQLGRED